MDKLLVQKMKLGIFVISATVLFILGVYLVGSKQSMFGSTAEIFATFNNVNGLRNGNNVRFSGIHVGTVKDLKMTADTTIVVKISIDKEVMQHIKKDAMCSVTSDGLVGSMVINILPGHGTSATLQKGDTLQSIQRVRTEDMLQTLSRTNENIALLSEELLTILKGINEGEGVISTLIKDPQLSDDMKEVVLHLKNTSKASTVSMLKINKMLEELNQKDNFIGLINDTSSVQKARNTIANVEKTSQELDQVMQNLNAAVVNANETIQNMKAGKGAINYLSNDAEFTAKIGHTMNNLDTTVVQINKAGIKLNENLEALKSSWLLRGYFKKAEKQKKN